MPTYDFAKEGKKLKLALIKVGARTIKESLNRERCRIDISVGRSSYTIRYYKYEQFDNGWKGSSLPFIATISYRSMKYHFSSINKLISWMEVEFYV